MIVVSYKFEYFDEHLVFEKNQNPNRFSYPLRGDSFNNTCIIKNIRAICKKLHMRTHIHLENHTNSVIHITPNEAVIRVPEDVLVEIRLYRLLYATLLACKMKAENLTANQTVVYSDDTCRVPENPDFEILKTIDKIENMLDVQDENL